MFNQERVFVHPKRGYQSATPIQINFIFVIFGWISRVKPLFKFVLFNLVAVSAIQPLYPHLFR
ncbi:MAG TPA: hypothetical protein VI791_00840 [Patescibacteria group bacterium]|nr:hypothetical protein [Patescibacteria group bacterium]